MALWFPNFETIMAFTLIVLKFLASLAEQVFSGSFLELQLSQQRCTDGDIIELRKYKQIFIFIIAII